MTIPGLSREKFRSLYLYSRENIFKPRMLKFATVGVSGILVNMAFLYVFTELFRIPYLISSILAIEISIISNFILNDLWTWRDRQKKKWWQRFGQYHISVGLTAIFANWMILLVLTEVFGVYYLLSNLIGIAVGTFSNYIVNDLWTFGKTGKSVSKPKDS